MPVLARPHNIKDADTALIGCGISSPICELFVDTYITVLVHRSCQVATNDALGQHDCSHCLAKYTVDQIYQVLLYWVRKL